VWPAPPTTNFSPSGVGAYRIDRVGESTVMNMACVTSLRHVEAETVRPLWLEPREEQPAIEDRNPGREYALSRVE
jgi:hypothetical protein